MIDPAAREISTEQLREALASHGFDKIRQVDER